MAIEIRPADPADASEFAQTMGTVFAWEPSDEGIERFKTNWEPHRSQCAYEDGTMVATLGTFSLDLTVPGATIPVGGTTQVSVLPSHRRQGLLRRLITAHLTEVGERGEAVAALWASESSIYGRFGFGTASTSLELNIPTNYRAFHRLAPEPGPVELIPIESALDLLPPIHAAIAAHWPGMFARQERWWRTRWFSDLPSDRGGATALRFAVTKAGDGYVVYRQKSNWDDGNAAGKLIVLDLIAASPESWSGLWSFVLAHDLVSTVEADLRSGQEPLLNMLAAPRRASARPSDGIWIRLNNPPEALAARRYSVEGELVIEAHDPLLGTTHTLLLQGGPEGAACNTTDRPPDLVLDSEDLGSAYLGWSRFRSLARQGRAGGDQQALALADAMFGWDPLPWCPEIF
ncbi:GNAT family N-acetyltransferase [soil metagenome]